MTKSEMRREFRDKRALIVDDERQLKERLIFQRAHKDSAFQLAAVVHVYCSTPEEVATSMFIEYAWGIGKDVVVPRMTTKDTFENVLVNRASKWDRDDLGIAFPKDGMVIDTSDLPNDSAAIVPIVAFDSSCNRIGYGRGVYDRFLSRFQGRSIGLAFETQRAKKIETEEHDITLHKVATEERWFEA